MGRPGPPPGRRPAPYRPAGFRPPPPDPNLVGPDEELVAGRRPVEEAFVAKRPAIRLLVVPQRRQALERLVLHATSLRIPIVEVEGGTLTALAGFDGHQGIALVAGPRRWSSTDEILARGIERGEAAFVLVLDSLEDPQNVGTLLRSAEAAGVHGVVFPTRHQAPLSPSAVKASAGAVEHLLLAPVDDLPGALSDLHIRGVRIVGAEAGAPLTARQADFRGPLAIVVGSEGQGLTPAVRRRCDLVVRIPMRGMVGSLNAAVAGSVLLFEAVAQRDPSGTGERPIEPAPPAEDAAEAEPTADAGRTADAEPISDAEPAEPAAEAEPTADAEPTAEGDAEPTADADAEAEPTADADLLPGGPAPS
jgi:23S rRNA (guanosine2251-2'-O)-methyltransferase